MKEKKYIPVLFRLRDRQPGDEIWKQGFVDSNEYPPDVDLRMMYRLVYSADCNTAYVTDYRDIKYIEEYSKEYSEISIKIKNIISKANVFEEEKSLLKTKQESTE